MFGATACAGVCSSGCWCEWLSKCSNGCPPVRLGCKGRLPCVTRSKPLQSSHHFWVGSDTHFCGVLAHASTALHASVHWATGPDSQVSDDLSECLLDFAILGCRSVFPACYTAVWRNAPCMQVHLVSTCW